MAAAAAVCAPILAAPAALPLVARAIVPAGPPAAIMPLSAVKPGMTGEALTVFSGTKPESFKVRVVSIVQNFIPKQDIILIKAEDPRVEFSGIAAGMSGSPVYIDGKLIGAIAYAWSFSKSPLAGVTPIEAMLAERTRARRATDDQLAAGEKGSGGSAPGGSFFAAGANGSGGATAPGEPRLTAVSIPLSVSGLSTAAMNDLADELRQFGIVPMRAGGGGGAGRASSIAEPGRIEPGSAVGVQLIRGDMNATAIGTVTYVAGGSLVAFGHPMFGIGEVSLPLVTGEVHTFIPSQASSFKLASPLVEVGTVIQDRPSCIVGDLTRQASMVPVEVKVASHGATDRTFRAEVARNRRLTPILASMVITSAIAESEPDVTEMAISLVSRLDVRGVGPIELRDQIFSPEGLSPRALSLSRGLRAFADLVNNPFEPVVIDRMNVDVRIEFRRDVAEIVAVSLPGDVVRAGDTIPLRVSLRPYAGDEYTETIPIAIAPAHAGQIVKIEVASGAQVKPDVARAESLRGFIDNLRSYYTASSIIVSVATPDDGVSLRGRLIPRLPRSALDTLRPGNQTKRADAYHVAERTVFPSRRLVAGKQEISVEVREVEQKTSNER